MYRKLETRTEMLSRIAGQLNMDYSYQDEWGVQPQLLDFRLFRRGLSFQRKVRHVLSLQDPMHESKVHIFDYRYLTFAGKHVRREEQSVFFIESRKLGLPNFMLHPESFFNKVGQLLNLTHDIDFETYPDFSYHYRLTGDDEDLIRRQFNHQILRFFSVERGWTVEGLGYYLLIYKRGKVLHPEVIMDFYQKGKKVYEALLRDH